MLQFFSSICYACKLKSPVGINNSSTRCSFFKPFPTLSMT